MFAPSPYPSPSRGEGTTNYGLYKSRRLKVFESFFEYHCAQHCNGLFTHLDANLCLPPVLDLLHAHGAREIRNRAYTKSRRLNDAFSKKIFPLCFGIVEREYFYYIYLLSCVVNLILHCRIERNKFFCL